MNPIEAFLSDGAAAGGNAAAPAAPAPAAAVAAQAAPQALAPQGSGTDPFGAILSRAQAQSVQSAPPGSTPQTAADPAPISLMEHAMLGWVRTPQEQEKYLRQRFDDVALVPSGSGASFSVKKDGKWMQANPDFEWKWSMPGALTGAGAGLLGAGLPGALVGAAVGGFSPTLIDSKNRAGGASALAKGLGEYGLRGEAATLGGVTGAELGAAAGPLGSLAGGAIGAGLGAAGMDAGELASRALAMDPSSPGARPYKSATDLTKEMVASAMFGATNYLAGKGVQWGAGKAAKAFATTLNSLGDTPEGRQAVRRLTGLLGMDPIQAEARLLDPMGNAHFDSLLAADHANPNPTGMGSFDKVQESLSNDLHGAVDSLRQKQAAEFAALQVDPAVRSAAINLHTNPNLKPQQGILFNDAAKALQDSGLVKPNLAPNELRQFGPNDKAAIDFITRNLPSAQGVGYGDARALVGDIHTLLRQQVFNPNLERIMIQLKDGINNSIADGLEDSKAGLGSRYGAVMSKYAEAKSLAEALDSATSGQKRFIIGKKLSSQAGNEAKATMDALVNGGVDPMLVNKFVQMEGSKASASLFGSSTFHLLGTDLPKPGPRIGRALVTGGAQVGGALSQAGITDNPAVRAALPYVSKAISSMKGLDQPTLKSLLTSPDALAHISSLITGAAQSERSNQDQLLQQLGVKP